MRIGIDGRLWNETGVGRYIRNLVKNLGEIDQKNEYVLFAQANDIDNIQFQISNFKFQIVKAEIRWHSLDEQVRFPSIINQEHLNLMHFPYFSVPIFYKGKFVVTIHDLIPLHFDTGLATTLPVPFYKAKRFGYKFVLRQTVKKTGKIIAVSNATKKEVIKHLNVDPEKIVVTYEGVDEQIAYRQSHIVKDDKLSAISDKQYFLYVGNAYPHKNLDRLIEAFQLAFARDSSSASRRTQNDIRLILVGKEDYFYRRLKEKVNDMGLMEYVLFKGEVGDGELLLLYRNAKALIMPSLMEGFGLPAVEAMANKCLVLASDIAVIREICGESAIYFNPYDVESIKGKMDLICSNDLDQESKKRKMGLAKVKQFSWRKMAEETLRIYEEVERG